MTRRCKNPVGEGVCGRPLVRVGVGQWVCRSCLARALRAVPSEKRRAASRANGRKGGRPRKLWAVERTDWFGECETVEEFKTRTEAVAKARELRRSSRAVDDPADKIRYQVVSFDTRPV